MLDINEMIQENERLSQENVQGNFLDNFVQMPEGNGHVMLRILPPAKPGVFERPKNGLYSVTRTHRVNSKSLHCPKELVNGKWVGTCPVCDWYNYLWAKSDKTSNKDEAASLQSDARKIKPVERYYYNVIVRQVVNEKTGALEKNVGPKILSVGKTLHKQIIRAMVGDPELGEAPLGDVTDFTRGRDFRLSKTMVKSGNDSFPNYNASKFLDATPAGSPDEITKWESNLHNLAALRIIKPFEEMKKQLKIHLGVIADAPSTNGFDPSEFQKNETTTTTTTVSSPTTAPAQNSASAPVSESPSEAIADDDFMKELKRL